VHIKILCLSRVIKTTKIAANVTIYLKLCILFLHNWTYMDIMQLINSVSRVEKRISYNPNRNF